MSEEMISISIEEQTQRNKMLRQKKIGMFAAIGLMIAMAGVMVWQLCTHGKLTFGTIWPVALGCTLLLAVAVFFYVHFVRLLNRDMASDQKIVMNGIVTDGNMNDPQIERFLEVETGGMKLHLGLKRLGQLIGDVSILDTVELEDELRLEMTPFGRILTRIELVE